MQTLGHCPGRFLGIVGFPRYSTSVSICYMKVIRVGHVDFLVKVESGKPTHILLPCRMPKPLPAKN